VALPDRLEEVLELAGAAGGHHRELHRVGDGPGELEVVARAGAVAVHAGGQDDAGAELLAAPGPLHRVLADRLRAARTTSSKPEGRSLLRRASTATVTRSRPKRSRPGGPAPGP